MSAGRDRGVISSGDIDQSYRGVITSHRTGVEVERPRVKAARNDARAFPRMVGGGVMVEGARVQTTLTVQASESVGK